MSESCPTNITGFRDPGGLLQPGFHFAEAFQHPTYNWHVIGWVAAAALTLFTWVIGLALMIRHFRNYQYPQTQKHMLRILLYPPVYATLAFASYLRFDYSTVIMLFAALAEALAIYNLYLLLCEYIKPFKDSEKGVMPSSAAAKVLFVYRVNVKDKFGPKFTTIINLCVCQFPVWSIVDAVISMVSQLTGYYCDGDFTFKGAYVYLTIVNFALLSVIIAALLFYLSIFHAEFQELGVKSHGMFWCIKGPIMILFYFGELLLTGLKMAGVIHGTTGEHSSDGIAWPVEAVKNGIYVIIVCVVMFVDMCLMWKVFNLDQAERGPASGKLPKRSFKRALFDLTVGTIIEIAASPVRIIRDSFLLNRHIRTEKKGTEKIPRPQTEESIPLNQV